MIDIRTAWYLRKAKQTRRHCVIVGLLPLVLLPLAAALPQDSIAWTLAKRDEVMRAKRVPLSITINDEWTYETKPREVIATRNGPNLDLIWLAHVPHTETAAQLGQPTSPTTTLDDLIEWYLKQQVTSASSQPRELSRAKVTWAGRPAFRLHLQVNLQGLAGDVVVESITYLAVAESGILVGRFAAPRLFYFPSALEAADRALQTVSFGEPPGR